MPRKGRGRPTPKPSQDDTIILEETDEDLKRAIELSLKSAEDDQSKRMNSVSSDDEEMKRVIELSLLENKNKAGSSQDLQNLGGASANVISDTSNISISDTSNISISDNSNISSAGSDVESDTAEDYEHDDSVWILSDEDEEPEPEYVNTRTNSYSTRLSSEEATKRMRTVFRKGLESKLNSTEMEPCKGIITSLHPHQKSALAWMCSQENKENQGMIGGILGDDMGLGKTVTMIALIFTNHHDQRPLAKKSYGYIRPPIESCKRTGKKRKRSLLNPDVRNKSKAVGVGGGAPFRLSTRSSSSEDELLDLHNSSSKKQLSRSKGKKSKVVIEENSESDPDDFDKMVKDSKSNLRNKFADKSIEAITNPEEEDNDEMYQKWDKMTQEEKDAMVKNTLQSMKPNMNLDGLVDSDSCSSCCAEDMIQLSLNLNLDGLTGGSDSDEKSNENLNSLSSSDDERLSAKRKNGAQEISSKKRLKTLGSDSDDLAEPENNGIEAEKVKPSTSTSSYESVNHIIPPKDPAVRGKRRRPTLIVCPMSLISHWCSEIDKHVDVSINVKVRVHHGASKALIGAELNACDIVITTYGTLATEFDVEDHGPLLKAKWLRVVLDEGHYIKNHRSKTARAALLLDTKRRWILTGTPIQNNLMDVWSLVHWLKFDLYADSINDFKVEIERPCKNREPVGFERLQTLMDTICLRRTKNDKKENGEPIVDLPSKTIIMRDVEFTEDERLCYNLMKMKATEIVERYQRRGELMRNYMHVLVMMLRFRQLCCHRELIKEVNWGEVMDDMEKLKKTLDEFTNSELNNEEGDDKERAKRLAQKLSQMIRDGVTEDCSVCLEDLRSPVITLCSHIYCRECIERVIDTTKPPLCPLCRGSVKKTELLAACDPPAEEEKQANKKSKDTLKKLEEIEYSFSSSKVNAALKELIRIRKDKPDDKMIVVSQFTSFLSIIQPLLVQEGFSFVRLDGTMNQVDRKETIDVFQSQGAHTPQVLLLSLKAGGVGLNLIAANHLLLMDPAWNPAAEWQCFDRIHRMGQTKEVFIYKYIVKDSIEKTMLEIQSRKQDIINGAFHMADDERRRQRIDEILTIFGIQG